MCGMALRSPWSTRSESSPNVTTVTGLIRFQPLAPAADHWGRVVAWAQSVGRPIGAMDAFLAAVAEHHQLTLVTRNVSDFDRIGVRLFNPWDRQ